MPSYGSTANHDTVRDTVDPRPAKMGAKNKQTDKMKLRYNESKNLDEGLTSDAFFEFLDEIVKKS